MSCVIGHEDTQQPRIRTYDAKAGAAPQDKFAKTVKQASWHILSAAHALSLQGGVLTEETHSLRMSVLSDISLLHHCSRPLTDGLWDQLGDAHLPDGHRHGPEADIESTACHSRTRTFRPRPGPQ